MKKKSTQHTGGDMPEETLAEFFLSKEAGRSFAQSLSVFSGRTLSDAEVAELRGLWETHTTLARVARDNAPRMATLAHIIDQIPAGHVTEHPGGGYVSKDAKGASIIGNMYHMTNMNWKIATPIAVLVLAVVAVTQMPAEQGVEKLAVAEPAMLAMESNEDASRALMVASAEPVSGNVDDLVASLSLEADLDLEQFADAGEDIALVSADEGSINDINSAYDETTF